MFLSKLQPEDRLVDDYLSKKFQILSFVAICFVIFGHGCNWEYFAGAKPVIGIAASAQYFIKNTMCNFMVSYFFFCSGFFMYASLKEAKLKVFLGKMFQRVRTLFIPWVIWLTIGIVFLYFFYQKLNFQIDWLNSPNRIKFLFTKYIWGDNDKLIYLWYLKRLMLFSIISPILYYLIKRLGFAVLFIAVAVSLTISSEYINEHFCAFIAGMSCCLKRVDLKQKTPLALSILFPVLWFAICVYCRFTSISAADVFVLNVTGVLGIWCLYDLCYPIIKRIEKPLLFIGSFTFFIYCFHILPLNVLDITFRMRGMPESIRLSGTVLGTLVISVLVGWILRRFIKPVYGILTGARG